jgi:tRNA(Ile2) C34 agmatinyltransferase TiaS
MEIIAVAVGLWALFMVARALTKNAPGRCSECGSALKRTGLGYAVVCHKCGHRRTDKI